MGFYWRCYGIRYFCVILVVNCFSFLSFFQYFQASIIPPSLVAINKPAAHMHRKYRHFLFSALDCLLVRCWDKFCVERASILHFMMRTKEKCCSRWEFPMLLLLSVWGPRSFSSFPLSCKLISNRVPFRENRKPAAAWQQHFSCLPLSPLPCHNSIVISLFHVLRCPQPYQISSNSLLPDISYLMFCYIFTLLRCMHGCFCKVQSMKKWPPLLLLLLKECTVFLFSRL